MRGEREMFPYFNDIIIAVAGRHTNNGKVSRDSTALQAARE
jgi:hypothetical protein